MRFSLQGLEKKIQGLEKKLQGHSSKICQIYFAQGSHSLHAKQRSNIYPTRESTMSKNSSETVGIANRLYMCKRKLKVRAFLASQSMKHIIKIFSGLDVKSRPVFIVGEKYLAAISH